MATQIVDYKGLKILQPAPTEAGGKLIQDNFVAIADKQEGYDSKFLVIEDAIDKVVDLDSVQVIPGRKTFGDIRITTASNLQVLVADSNGRIISSGYTVQQIINAAAAPDLTNYYTKAQVDAHLALQQAQVIDLDNRVTVLENTSGGGGELSTINSVESSGGDIEITIDGYQVTNSGPGFIEFGTITPLSVSLVGGATYEHGQVVNPINLTWSYNNGDADPDTSQSLNQGIGSLPVSQRAYSYTTDVSTDTTFTLTGVDSTRGSDSDSTTVAFGLRRYSGVTTQTVMTSADVVGDASEANFISVSSSPDYVPSDYDCSGGAYFFYAYPSSLGVLSGVNTKVNGLSFSDWSANDGSTASTSGFAIDIINAYGHVEEYQVYKVYNLQNGSAIPVEYRD